METAVSQRRFTVDEFHRLGEVGILDEDDRVELLDGRIIEMAAIGSRHAACVRRLNRWLGDRVSADLLVDVQNPVHLDAETELYPDLMVLRHRDDFYSARHPRPEDVLLVVEVADTSVEYDRRRKIPRYGRAGIQEAWLVNLPDRRVETWYSPETSGGYDESATLREGETIESTTVPGLSIEVDELLP